MEDEDRLGIYTKYTRSDKYIQNFNLQNTWGTHIQMVLY